MNIEKIILKRNAEQRLKQGGLWVFSNELVSIPKLIPGSIVEVIDTFGNSYGLAYFNSNSLITLRLLLTYTAPDLEFFISRIQRANYLRKEIYHDESSYRLVFGESDFLPGLIIDKYNDYFSVQIISAGMEIYKEFIFNALLNIFPDSKGIIEKNNSHLRQMEGLDLYEKKVFGEIPDKIVISESGIKYEISLLEGQKTGFYLDQRENRLFLRRIAKHKKILDCFTNQGGFGLNAVFAGAKSVTGIDSSVNAIDLSKNNAEINGFKNINFLISDVVEYLNEQISVQNKFDIIILDPPAFAKNKKSVPTARAGYAKINRLAISLIEKNGYLATASCSYHINEEVFYEIITKEATKQNKRLQLVFRGGQAPDHPILSTMPETAYLKFFVFSVV